MESLDYTALGRTSTVYTITNLKPSTYYELSLRLVHTSGDVVNPVRRCQKVTEAAGMPRLNQTRLFKNHNILASSPPIDFKVSDTTMNSVTLFWNKPEQPNGDITGYQIKFGCTNDPECLQSGQIMVI